ncbi:hypothetical protein [Nakamurella aerolata]|uniref:hypothetical protein n=1 Tax=Nakamurella aerolata TaxID=1656892 RepID=UPI001BB1434B|nr:hypothetical protein [Nakamurella aerolata]
MTFHPWRELRHRPEIDVVWRPDLPIDVLGVIEGRTVLMDAGQLQPERRCTITHELIHHERGETCGRVSPAAEADVRREAARRLIGLDELITAVRWSLDVHEVADACWVDLDTALARLQNLTPAEATAVRDAAEHHWMTS